MTEVRTRFAELADLALRALPQMYDDASGLFSQKALVEGGRLVNRGANPYYSAASLVGILSQARVAPEQVVPVGRALDALWGACSQGGGGPALQGTAIWAGALAGDARFAGLIAGLDAGLEIEATESAGLGQAMHGVLAAAEAFPEQRDAAVACAQRCADQLLTRFSPRAELFRAMPHRPTGLTSLLGARITSFASQVYPLLGLSSHFRLHGASPPGALRRVAERIVRAQGPLGQWWWLYSPRAGNVLEGYPVYSVHQDGMAFMGLIPVQRLGEGSYDAPLALGLDWLFARNELSLSLVEDEPPFIPRNIQRCGSEADAPFGISRAGFHRVVARSLLPSVGGDRTAASPASLEPLRECRSYHLGWLLYADSLLASPG